MWTCFGVQDLEKSFETLIIHMIQTEANLLKLDMISTNSLAEKGRAAAGGQGSRLSQSMLFIVRCFVALLFTLSSKTK